LRQEKPQREKRVKIIRRDTVLLVHRWWMLDDFKVILYEYRGTQEKNNATKQL
jgi:hypothetical protein